MKRALLLLLLLPTAMIGQKINDAVWITEKHDGYQLHYTPSDLQNKNTYGMLLDQGMLTVKTFFHSTYPQLFNVYVHPRRHSLDSAWQKDWNMPDFKSECWMVASGIATKLDMISPKQWDREACEHVYGETTKTQQLITHELVHVYHGQRNVSPDFSDTEGIDWFVEGLATYASGQCDSIRLAEVKIALADDKIPKTLDQFWTGKLKYGLSGSMVMFIDKKYGRSKLSGLVPFRKKSELLNALQTTESELLQGWQKFVLNV